MKKHKGLNFLFVLLSLAVITYVISFAALIFLLFLPGLLIIYVLIRVSIRRRRKLALKSYEDYKNGIYDLPKY